MLKTLINKILIIIFSIIILSSNISYAEEKIVDINKKGSISINHLYNDYPLSNVNFELFKVANILENGEVSILDEFKEFDMSLEELKDESQWYDLSEEISNFIEMKNITPKLSLYTDNGGSVKFSNLEVGLYLIDIAKYIYGDTTIVSKPTFISIPSKEPKNGIILYDLIVNTKSEELPDFDIAPPEGSSIEISVEKVWKDDDGKSVRPKSIEVILYKDEKVFSNVTLNESNKWKYLWENLDPNSIWTIKEDKVPTGYEVKYEGDNYSFIITNTYVGGKTDIPYTGTEFFKTPLAFIILGAILILVGYVITKYKPNENKETK